MAEISRSEAMLQIGKWYGGFLEKPSEDAIHKAISDMKKLEKIEKILEEWQEAYCEDCSLCGGCCRLEEILDLKEQILRGGE